MFHEQIQAIIEQVDQLRHQVNDHWQIPRDEADFLAMLVRVGRFKCLCEIGTSYGFSTLHLAGAAAEYGGMVHSFDIEPRKHEAAAQHLEQAGLREHVQLHLGDACKTLAQVDGGMPYDFIFIDATKAESQAYLEAVWPKTADKTLLVTDNTQTHASELQDFVSYLRSLASGKSCAVPIGNGVELTWIER